jgi:hypothetical protein
MLESPARLPACFLTSSLFATGRASGACSAVRTPRPRFSTSQTSGRRPHSTHSRTLFLLCYQYFTTYAHASIRSRGTPKLHPDKAGAISILDTTVQVSGCMGSGGDSRGRSSSVTRPILLLPYMHGTLFSRSLFRGRTSKQISAQKLPTVGPMVQ